MSIPNYVTDADLLEKLHTAAENFKMPDRLEVEGKLTSYDYDYLRGTWDGPMGAAFNVVAEWCQNHRFGSYGEPTKKGSKAMEAYLVNSSKIIQRFE